MEGDLHLCHVADVANPNPNPSPSPSPDPDPNPDPSPNPNQVENELSVVEKEMSEHFIQEPDP